MTDPRIEDATGRTKEGLGAITGNDDLKAEGQVDQASPEVHKTVNEVADAPKGSDPVLQGQPNREGLEP